MKGNRVIKIVTAVAVLTILVGLLIPVGVSFVEDRQTTNEVQSEGETIGLTGSLDATVTNVDDAENQIDYEITDGEDTEIVTVSVGTTETVTVSGNDVDINAIDIIDSETVETEYSFDRTHAWSAGGSGIYAILGLLFVLVVFLYTLSLGIKGYNKH